MAELTGANLRDAVRECNVAAARAASEHQSCGCGAAESSCCNSEITITGG